MTAFDPKRAAELLELADRVLAPTYARPSHVFVSGSGCWLEDASGERFLDMATGIAVNALGHASDEIAGALTQGARGLVHVSNMFHTAPAIELAAELVEHSFAKKVFFANSGSEANEGAIKFARLHGGDARRKVVYFEGSFHGRTLGSLAATDREDFRDPFTPVAGGFEKAAWDDLSALSAIDGSTAAAIVEPIQGESGIRVPDSDWMRALRRRCDETGTLLIFDEVQCGLGRSGTLWAHEGFAVAPDIMTLAKPLAGGLPMGAVLLGETAANTVKPKSHATTFGGGPLVASVALSVFRTISRPDFLAEVRRKGELLRGKLEGIDSPHVAEIRGRGLFLGVKIRGDLSAARERAFEQRLLLVPAGDNVLRFLPPLNAPDTDLEEAVARLSRALHNL